MLHLIVGQKYPSILGVISILAFLFLGSVIPLSAATDDVRVAELKKAAEKEGKVVFYTSIAAADSPVFVGRFQKKYPFLKVDLVRLNNMGILTRVLAEHRANKNIVDVVDLDFMLSQEGQEMVAQVGKIPPRTGLTTKTIRSEDVMPIDPTIEKTEYYQKLLKQIFENK